MVANFIFFWKISLYILITEETIILKFKMKGEIFVMKKIALLILCMGLLVTTVAHALEEDVAEFKNWYGVLTDNQKEIVTFSYTDQATLYVQVDKQRKVSIRVYHGVQPQPVSIQSIEVDEEIIPLNFDYRMTQEFARGGTAVFNCTDQEGRTIREKFSLYGFTRAYRWLIR